MPQDSQPDLSTFLVSSIHDMKNSLGLLSAMLEKMLSDLSPDTYADYAQLAHMFYEGALKNQVQHFWEKMLHGKTVQTLES